ncbi:hypothetical protein CRYUN_Cryun37aG0002400 [Craigia yunnanensis]
MSNVGLHLEFTLDDERYNVIWIQWCVGHLIDDDLVSFFKRAKVGLKLGGFFVLKENIARNGPRDFLVHHAIALGLHRGILELYSDIIFHFSSNVICIKILNVKNFEICHPKYHV